MSNSYYEITRFLIIAPTRSGGTLLSHALDSHPDIYCHRDEPMHKNNPIWRICGTPFIALDTCLKMPGYEASGAKITYEQYKRIGMETVNALKPDKIIHLYRDNALERIASEYVRQADKENGLRTHTRESRDLQAVYLHPGNTIKELKKYSEDVSHFRKHLKQLANAFGKNAYYEVTYEQLSMYHNIIDRDLGFELQRCLGMSNLQMLKYSIVKRNPYPLQDIISNYDELYEYMHLNAYKYLKYFD